MTEALAPAIRAQIAAADPIRSSWVAANAGSGKTRVLTNRVARLLLTGTEPQKILCLTYTKAAAAEMQTRLFQTLGTWSMLDDDDLARALADLGGGHASRTAPEDLSRARTLFARALETPGGLKIQTIHAFCEALLRRFPLEAGVPPQFSVLEDRQARALRANLLDTLAETRPDAMADLATYLSGDDPDPLLREIAQNRAAFTHDLDIARLAAALGANLEESLDAIAARAVGPADLELLSILAPLLAASSANDQKAATALATALPLAAVERLEALEGVLLTKSGAAPFSAKTGKFPTKPIRSAHADLCARLDDLMGRVETARARRIGRLALDRSAALNRFARVWLDALDARKAGPGVLDFDDMIERTRALLSNPATAAWVLWRLDGGLDHVLVDEAQDTSPNQWQVVRAITDEFFAGLGASNVVRTVFVVGDEKQSIYSFQGADPRAFGHMRGHFDAVLEPLGAPLQHCALIYSFRSAAPVLRLVDAVFQGPAALAFEAPVEHAPFDPDRPGRVEVWPFLPKPEKAEEPPWYAPVDTRGPDDPVELLAGHIAKRIAGWLAEGRALPGPRPERIRAGDVMILVQRRNALFHAIIRALKRHDVAVAGADVLRIGAELAVKDLLACLRVAATPNDDLSLAAMLRSPLGQISEEDLFALAHDRPSLLWRELRSAEAPVYAQARALISDLLDHADYLRPFELLQRILIRHDGRRKLIARLGPEAEDGIDALLDQVLDYERSEPPTLTGFLAWIDRDELQVKRRSDESADQVRVMTVHGSKGLEAPIVILPDTVDRSEARNAPEILVEEGGLAFWRTKNAEAPEILRRLEEARRLRAEAENMRLLYVALTRAERWLIVCGAGRDPKPDGRSWYALTRNAMEALEAARENADEIVDGGETLTLSHNWSETHAPASAPQTEAKTLPAWCARPAPEDTETGPPVLLPSQLGGAHALFASLEPPPEADSRARGDAIHLLLEHLAEAPRENWQAIAAQALPPETDAMDAPLAEVETILAAPELAPLFGPDTLAEVEISAPLSLGSDTPRIQGRIDRLVIRPDCVLAVDFKSNTVVPETPEQIPEGILRQLGAYHAGLAAIWPDRRIATGILWTRTAVLMEVPETLVRSAFARACTAIRDTGRRSPEQDTQDGVPRNRPDEL